MSIDADKIATYVAEFKRRGVREEWIKPIFLAACDAGFLFFPPVDSLIALRPRRKTLPTPRPSVKQQIEFKRGYEWMMAEINRICGLKAFPKPKTPQQLQEERVRQKQRMAEWMRQQGQQ